MFLRRIFLLIGTKKPRNRLRGLIILNFIILVIQHKKPRLSARKFNMVVDVKHFFCCFIFGRAKYY